MTLEMGSNVDTVLNAVNKLYHDNNPSEKEKASKWLGEFQKSIFAWETADQLLQRKNCVESTYFAAQTLRTKILYNFNELPPTTHESLKTSLLNHMEQLNTMSPILITQLSLSVCDLALQMPSWKAPAVTLMQKYGNDKAALPYLLEILTVLPEEVNNRALRLGSNRRCEIMEEMENSAPMVIELLKSCVDTNTESFNEQLSSKIFKCLGSWFSLGILPGNHVARCKLLDTPFKVLGDVNAPSSLHEAAADCVCSALYAAEDVVRHSDLIILLFHGTHQLRDAYHYAVAQEDTDKCVNFCRVFTELAESLLESLISHPGEGLGDLITLDLLLQCNGHCQYEVAEITFNLWYRLSEMVYANDHDQMKRIFGPYVERLIYTLVKHAQMEPDNDKILEDTSDFHDFRLRASELVRDVVFLVGATECFCHLFSLLTNSTTPPTWDVTEATLYIMTAVAKLVNSKEEQATPQVLHAILSLPENSHISVRNTSIKLVGELSAWIEKHSQFLNPVLEFLTTALHKHELASSAATSLQYLCEMCYNEMSQHYQALIRLIEVSDDLKVSNEASLGLLKGIVIVLSRLPASSNSLSHSEGISQVISLQANKLNKAISSQPQNGAKSESTVYLDRLAAIFRNFDWDEKKQQSPHPCKDILSQIWPVFEHCLNEHKSDNKSVERWCRCVRFAVRCVGRNMEESLLQSIAQTITRSYAQYQHSCFLYLGSVLVDVFGGQESLFAMLDSFAQPSFNILNEEKGLENHPDTVDDLFRLCTRFMEKCAHLFLRHSACPSLIECALAGLYIEHRDANASVTRFLRIVIENKPSVGASGDDLAQTKQLCQQVVTSYGNKIVERSLNACLFHIPSYLYPDIAELWWAIIEKDRVMFSEWLKASLKNLPSEATLATATPHQTLNFHNEIISATEWKTVSYHLRDFCRLYR